MHSSLIDFSATSGGEFVRVPLLSPPVTNQVLPNIKSGFRTGSMSDHEATTPVFCQQHTAQPGLTQGCHLRLPPFQHIAQSAGCGAAVGSPKDATPASFATLSSLNREGPAENSVMLSPQKPQEGCIRRSSGGTQDLATYAVTANPLGNHSNDAINSLAHLASLSQSALLPTATPQSQAQTQKSLLQIPVEPVSPTQIQGALPPYPAVHSPATRPQLVANCPASVPVPISAPASVLAQAQVQAAPVSHTVHAASAVLSPLPPQLFESSPTPSDASSISSCTSNTFERPYKCVYRDCGRSFARVSDQRRHIRSHEKPRLQCPFWKVDASCHRNGGAFNRLDVLKRHLKLVHFVPPTESDAGWCKCCHKQFTNVRDFIDHAPLCAVRARPQEVV